ncbi:GAF domain-containing protein, partial [Amnimonas aquatica]
MQAAKIPYNQYHHPKLADPGRLAALHATGLLGSPPEASFDRFTRLASMLLDTPFTAISLIDLDDVFIKSQSGALEGACNKPVNETFCQHTVGSAEPLVINDTRLNELVCDNPAVQAGALSYLAIPLVTDQGHTLGTLCAVEGEPRQWSARDIHIMTDLAASVMIEIELRQLTSRLLGQYNQLRATELQRDEMVHMLVHDLRNPLTSLLAGLHLIDGVSPLDPGQQQA